MSAMERLHTLRVTLAAKEATTESLALAVGALAFVIVGLVAWPVLGVRHLAISGHGSIGEYVVISGACVAFAAFVTGRVFSAAAQNRNGESPLVISGVEGPLVGITARRAPRVFDVGALALAHAVIALLAWDGIATLLEMSFQGAEVYTIPAVLLSGSAAAVTGYFSYLSAAGMNLMRLSGVLLLFLVVGALTSMLTARDPNWWKLNLSALGMTDDMSAMAFNLTLVVAGLILTTIARYATADFMREGEPVPHGVRAVRWGLVVMGVALACVGIFHVDDFFVVHNTAATGMVVAFAVIVIGLPKFLPQIARPFVVLGYVFLAVIVGTVVFFAIGYYNLTAVELVAAVLIFSWIIVFLRTVHASTADELRADAFAQRDAVAQHDAGGDAGIMRGESGSVL